jgi:hypothetical protein
MKVSKQTSKLLSPFVLVWIMLASTPVSAIPISAIDNGPGVETGSWTINLGFVSGNFDSVELFIENDTGAGPFENDGASNFSVGGWSAQLINPGYSLLAGPTTNTITYDWHFAGDITQSVNVDLFLYDSGSLIGSARFLFSNGEFLAITDVRDASGVKYDRTPVPEPAVLALMGIGLLGFGVRRLRWNGRIEA